MSSIGLNTNTFRLTGKYLDFLNDFVVRIKVNPEVDEGKRDQLIEFITKINDDNNAQPQFQLLSSIIERELRPKTKTPSIYLKAMIKEIEDNEIDRFLPKVEFLVEILDTENSEALAKIVGD